MLKFGRIVAVDAMQEARINEPAEELKARAAPAPFPDSLRAGGAEGVGAGIAAAAGAAG